MPKLNRKLTDTEIRNAKPKEADYKLYDDGGLRLLVRRTGTKVWQFPYKLNDKSNVCTLGQYPQMGAFEARKARDDIRTLIKQGTDPNQKKKAHLRALQAQTENTFENIARKWHGKQIWAEKYSRSNLMRMEKDVFPVIGIMPIEGVTPKDILSILRKIEERGALDVARRTNQQCTAIFDYAIDCDLCETNPATGRSRTIKARAVTHRPGLKAEQIPEFLERLKVYSGGKIVQLGLELLLLTFVRPGELANALWEEVDFEKAQWVIPPERMKMKRKHIVPLSEQALACMQELRKITGKTNLLFPSELNSDKPISNATFRKALIIMGYVGDKKIVPHGMRSTASTILNEARRFHPDAIERQLAHVQKNKVRAAYNHAEYMEERIEMMQWWANHLEK